MKTLLALVLALSCSAFAATSVDGNMNVVVDGSNRGVLETYIANNPAQTSTVMLAVRAYNKSVSDAAGAALATKETEKQAAITAAQAQRDAAIATAQAQRDAAVAAAQAARDTAQAAKTAAETAQAAAVAARTAAEAKTAAIVANLKGVAPQLLPANVRAELLTAQEAERVRLLAAKADAEAKLAALP